MSNFVKEIILRHRSFGIRPAIVGGCLLSLIIGYAVAKHERQLISRVATAVTWIVQTAKVIYLGEEKLARDVLAKNYAKFERLGPESSRTIDSSRLPLLLTTVPLKGSGQFAASDDLVRGALARVEDHLVVMDKLGNIFQVDGGVLRKLDYGVFPSNIEKSITRPFRPLPVTAVRSLYIAYDKVRSRIYVSLQKYDVASQHVKFNISSININRQTLEKVGEWSTVFETEDIPDDASFRGATGGRIIIAGDKLYFSIGDYNFGQVPTKEFELVAQKTASSFGKIYEHDMVLGKTRVKSSGHRNPQGLVLTSGGLLMDTEHGPEGGDELNVIVDGNNYGWPYKTYGTDYGTFDWPVKFAFSPINFSEPIFSWVPSVAASPIIQVSDFDESWDSNLLVGSLKAQSIFRLKMIDDRIVFSEPIWIGHRIRDIIQMPSEIVLLTDDPALVFVRVDKQRLKENSKLQKNVEFIPALAKCLNCHHFGETNPSHLAPTLANIKMKRIASDSFQRYSDGLKKKVGSWDDESLTRYIGNPSEFAPGSTMPSLGLSALELREVVTALGARPK